jgi:multiple sugar transport system permease protein
MKQILKRREKGPISQMDRRKTFVGYMFLAPFLILFVTFTLIPIFVAMGLSLTNYNLIQTPGLVGLTNYMNLILEDDVFLTSLKNTLLFALLTGPTGYLASFMMAWLITLMNKGRGAFALAFYAPSLTSGVAMSTIWLIIFSGDRNGYLNNFMLKLGVILEPILWTKDANYLKWVIVIISVWMSMGTGFLVFLAGLQNIDPSLYEAARVDGMKNRFQELRYITLPMMKPQLLFGAVTSVVNAFAIFDVATSVAGMPSPNYAAHTIVAHLYDYAFIRMNMGYASSVAMILFIMTFLIGRICFYIFRSED